MPHHDMPRLPQHKELDLPGPSPAMEVSAHVTVRLGHIPRPPRWVVLLITHGGAALLGGIGVHLHLLAR